MAIAGLFLGSNLFNRRAYLLEALNLIGTGPVAIKKLSPLYETEPVECSPQPWFLNRVVIAETGLSPLMLLEFLLDIEKRLGRRRPVERGARTIDIDLLFVDGVSCRTAKLTLPHHALASRRCVLVPLCDAVPSWRHPVLGLAPAELLAACHDPGRVIRTTEQGS